jgi:capsular exopolysaccharide synthesis family protein
MSERDSNTGGQPAGGTATASAGTLTVREPSVLAPAHLPAPHAFPAGGGELLAGGIDYLRVLHSARRRWLPASLLGLLLAAIAATPVWLLMPRGFEAVAWLRVRDKGGMLSHGRDGAEYESYKKTQLSMLRSPFVLQGALRRPGLEDLETLREAGPDQIGWLSRSLQVTAPGESEVVQVRLRGKNPTEVAKIVNAVVSSFLDDIVNKDRTERLGRRDALEKKFKENMAELRTRRETLNNLARTLGTRDSSEVATQRGLLLDHLGTLRQLVTATQRAIADIDAELSISEARERGEIPAEDHIPPEMIEAALARDPQIAELIGRLADLEDAISFQAQRSARGMNDAAVRRLRGQAEEVLQRLETMRRDLRPALIAQLDAGGRAPVSPSLLKKRKEMLSNTLEDASKEFDALSKEVTELGKANADLDARKIEVEHLQRVTDQIGIELESSSIDLNAPNRITLIEPASVPHGSDRMMRILFTLIAGGVGFSLGGGLVLLVDYLRDCLSEPDDVSRRVGVRVLGTFPLLSKLRNQPDYGGVMAECGDTIRTLISQSGRGVPKVILVTSAIEHEGKTTFAAQLAASLARADKRTLLLDGDLRHPNAHLALDLELRTGLPELLRGELSTDEAVQPTSIDGLFAVTGGECDYAAITALSRPDLGKVIGGFRESFDHVVIDAGPVLAFADALLLGQQSDAAILAAMVDVSRVPQVSHAVDRLRSVGVRLLGVVVNGGGEPAARRGYAAALPS